MVLVRAEKSEFPLIASLARAIWMEYYPAFIPEHQLTYMLNLFYTQSALEKQEQEGQQFFLLMENDKPVGFLGITPESDAVKINKWYILKQARGKGLGKMSWQMVRHQFASFNRFYLTVNRKNYKSINFYFQLGFTIREVADFDIGGGYFMEDFVMENRTH